MESVLTLSFLLVVAFFNSWAVRAGRNGSSSAQNRALNFGLLGLVMLSATLFFAVFWAAGLVLMEISKKGSSYTSSAGIAMFASALITLVLTGIAFSSALRCSRSNNAAVV